MGPEFAASLIALVAAAVVLDLRTGRVPNGLVLSIATLGVVVRGVGGWSPHELATAFTGLAVGLAVWIGPFALRWVGGGDVKLVAAVGAWLGPLATVRVSVYAALAGGLLALGYLMIGWLRAPSVEVQLSDSSGRRLLAPTGAGADFGGSARGMPYAVAVLVGLLVELYLIR